MSRPKIDCWFVSESSIPNAEIFVGTIDILIIKKLMAEIPNNIFRIFLVSDSNGSDNIVSIFCSYSSYSYLQHWNEEKIG